MILPAWTEELKARYLGDEASVFLLHGAVDGGRWMVEGRALDCMATLVQFLSRSREILGVLDPARGLSFPGIGDRSRFQTVLGARRTLDKDSTHLREDKPEECLSLLYRAVTTPGVPQAYILIYSERLFPERKSVLPGLSAKTPPFPEWIDDPRLRQSDNLLVLLAEDLNQVHHEIRARLGRGLIEVPDDHPPVHISREVTADVDLRGLTPARPLPEDGDDDLTPLSASVPPFVVPEALAEPPPLPDAPPPPEPPLPPPPDALEEALTTALRRHPQPPWPGLLPAREALAEVIFARAPQRCGPLTFERDGEDNVTTRGPGAEWFQSWFDNGVVVRAAAEQLLHKLGESLSGNYLPEGERPPLDEAKLRALRKQIDKALESA